MNFNYLFDAKTTSSVIASSYHTLMSKIELKSLIQSLIQNPLPSNLGKQELHKIIDDLILLNHTGEIKYKYLLAKMFVEEDSICAFEVKTPTNRIDFVRVNGISNSYEIKSGLDNLLKLEKQSNNYNKFFKKNYIVIDEKHLEKAINIVPGNYGIIINEKNKLVEKRKAIYSNCLNPVNQLSIFSKKELAFYFKELDITKIINTQGESLVNKVFKEMIKKRYSTRWKFLLSRHKEIYSIDYQFFFQKNIQPCIIYSA